MTDDVVTVPIGTWAEMTRSLLQTMIKRYGSIRKAAGALNVPRSTLGTWVKRGRQLARFRDRPEQVRQHERMRCAQVICPGCKLKGKPRWRRGAKGDYYAQHEPYRVRAFGQYGNMVNCRAE